MSPFDLSVCVAVHRRHGPPNLESLSANLHSALAGLTWELIVALNGIGPAEAGLPDGAHQIAFDQNQGVPIAWNAAASVATGRALAIVNDDVVLGEGSLRLLVDSLGTLPDAGVVGPVGTHWDIASARHVGYVDTEDLPPGAGLTCEVLSGFLLVTPRDVFERAGGFDEALTPCGFEEVDYCTTVRLRLGLECYAVAGVAVDHDFGISARRPWRRVRYKGRSESLGRIAARNRAHFLSKWSDGSRLASGRE